MTTSDHELAVHRTVTVPLARDRAFALFTARMGAFWPAGHSIGSTPIADVVVEPHAGGRWFERGTDGSECDWGRVAVWQPDELLVLLWQIGADFRADPEISTEVEVRFTEVEAGRTRVDLTHHHLERYADAAEQMRAVFDSPGGWTGILDAFGEVASRWA